MAFSFERKILKSSDLQEQVRINDIIMSCHLFSSEKNNNNDNKKPNSSPCWRNTSILFLQWAICSPSNLSLAQNLPKGDCFAVWRRNASRHQRSSGKGDLGKSEAPWGLAGGGTASLAEALLGPGIHVLSFGSDSSFLSISLQKPGLIWTYFKGHCGGCPSHCPAYNPWRAPCHLQDKVLTPEPAIQGP